MDDLTKALDNYKDAFNKKLVNFTLELPILDEPPITPKEATVKNEPVSLESENEITALDSPIYEPNIEGNNEEKPKENDKIKHELGKENPVVAPTYIPEDRTTVGVEESLTETRINDITAPKEPLPPQPSTPQPTPTPIKRHIMHRVITSTGARFGLALLLLLFL